MAQQLPLVEDLDRSTTPADPRRKGVGRPAGRSRRAVASAPRTGAGRRGGRALAAVASRPDVLVEVPGADWRIDEHTKQVGLAGVAEARRALASARGRNAA